MATNINVVVIEGNLARDPQIRNVGDNGNMVSTFTVAVNKSYKSNDNWMDKTAWVAVKKWNPSEHLRDNMNKGSHVIVEGSLETEEWNENDGNKKSRMVVNASRIRLITKKDASEGNQDGVYEESTDDNEDLPF